MSSDRTVDAAEIGLARQRLLLDVLACPQCQAPLSTKRETRSFGAVVRGDLECERCGRVGGIRAHRPTFIEHGDDALARDDGAVREPLALDGTVERTGSWRPSGPEWLGEGVGTAMRGASRGIGVVVALRTFDWSGRALVSCAGRHELVDLYSLSSGSRTIVFEGLPDGIHLWSIEIVEGRHPDSHGDQVLVASVDGLVPPERAAPRLFEPVNRGNPFPTRFEQLVRATPDEAVIFDIGGGDRVHEDPRVFNFEYLPYLGPDMYGDGHHLPIQSESVDLVLSQAVLEHVPDPVRAVAEMYRILRPGGLVYAEIAFMQPLHAVPFHFFNVTPHGIAYLFEAFETIETGSFGGLHGTMEWFFRLCNAGARIGDDRAEQVLASLRDLDRTLNAVELEQFASAVFIEARKPLS